MSSLLNGTFREPLTDVMAKYPVRFGMGAMEA
jgi:hypothetical protein